MIVPLGAVVIEAEVAAQLCPALNRVEAELRRDGIHLPAVTEALRELRQAALEHRRVSDVGHFVASRMSDPPPSTDAERLTTTEVGRRIGRTPRTAQRWCETGRFPTAELVGGTWTISSVDPTLKRAQQ